jgi:hypothetical protein
MKGEEPWRSRGHVDHLRPRDESVAELAARLDKHEEICALRWGQVLDSIGQIKAIMLGCAGTLIVGMAGIIVTLILRSVHL